MTTINVESYSSVPAAIEAFKTALGTGPATLYFPSGIYDLPERIEIGPRSCAIVGDGDSTRRALARPKF